MPITRAFNGVPLTCIEIFNYLSNRDLVTRECTLAELATLGEPEYIDQVFARAEGKLYRWNVDTEVWEDFLPTNTGPAGQDGTNGTNGINGSDGDEGANGENGISAYQIALNNGFVGSESAWLLSLKGTNGTNGTNGLDAKRIDSYSGTTDANGLFTVTYTSAFPAVPNVQPEPHTSNNHVWQKVTSTTTGFSFRLVQRNSVNLLATDLLLASVTNVSSASVKAIVVAV